MIKAMVDVRVGDTIGGRRVISRNRIGEWVTLDFGDSEPLVRRWYHKVDVNRVD